MTIQDNQSVSTSVEEDLNAVLRQQVYTVHAVFRTDDPDHLELILGTLGAAIPTIVGHGVNVDLKVE